MTIGESIRYHRKKLCLTQSQLADRVGVSVQAVSKWENNVGMPDISMAVPLARALGTTTDELLRFGERYKEFEVLWEKALRTSGDNELLLLETAEAALREFHYDGPFMFRAAWSAKTIAENSNDPAVREEYLGRAGAHAQCAVEMDPDNATYKELRTEIFRKLQKH